MHSTTVIIRVKNEENWIGHSIQSILDQIKSPRIIIIDNNSSDSSLTIAKLFKHDTSRPQSARYADIDIMNINEYPQIVCHATPTLGGRKPLCGLVAPKLGVLKPRSRQNVNENPRTSMEINEHQR